MKAVVTQRQLDSFRTSLDRDRRRIASIIAGDKEELQDMAHSAMARSDEAALSEQRGQVVAEAQGLEQELAAIEAAIARIAAGDYGTCVDCGRAIPFGRLQALPTVERDTGCQAAFESLGREPGSGRRSRRA